MAEPLVGLCDIRTRSGTRLYVSTRRLTFADTGLILAKSPVGGAGVEPTTP